VCVSVVFSGAVLAAPHTVVVGGSDPYGNTTMFNPSALTIQAGDTVTFTNVGGLHNVAANDGSFRCANGCDGQGGNGDPSNANWSTTITFDHAGSFGYHCEVHASLGMTGNITVEGAPPPPPPAFNMDQHGLSGSWANLATESQGLVMEVYPDLVGNGAGALFGGWFTFDETAAGGQRWYTVQGTVESSDDSAVMPIYLTDGGAFATGQATTTTPVGQVTLHFDDCSHGTMDYTFSDGSGRTGSIPLTRLLENVTCGAAGDNGAAASSYLLGGTWFDAGNSGQGLVIDINPPMNVMFAAWYTYLADADPASGPAGQHWYTLQAAITPGFTSLTGVGIFDSAGGVFDQHATTTTTPVGTADLVFNSCGSITMNYTFTAGPNAGRSGTLDLTRVGPTPAGCSL
jgi:plastocyanin